MSTRDTQDIPKIVHDDLRVVRDPDRGRVELWQKGQFIGFLGYTETETADGEQSVVILQHTIIDEQFGRRGYARALVTMVLDRLQAEGFLIVPECTYVQDYLERYPEYLPLVHDGPLRD